MQPALIALTVFSIVLFLITKPLGLWLTPLAKGRAPAVVEPADRAVLHFLGLTNTPQTWAAYAASAVVFNMAGAVFLYLILRFQGWLPFNPQGVDGMGALQAFNVAVSFVTGTNWQSYSGEVSVSYFSQAVGLAVQNFCCSCTGTAVSFALMRGFSRKLTDDLGNFWADVVRCALWVYLPLCVIYALFLVSQGVIQNWSDYAVIQTLAGGEQTIAMGPVASQEAIKMIGTNGGGFFAVNSAHPFENPTQITNFIASLAILAVPAGLTYTFGVMARDTRQGGTIWAAMWLIFALCTVAFAWFELDTPQVLTDLGVPEGVMNPEGKEARFDIAATVLFSMATTAASCGAVNAMHDSFTALGGMFPLWLMQMDEVVFGGVGAGFYGMIVFAVVGVFAAGLMVGRTPEYIGKKITPVQMKLAGVAMLTPPMIVLFGTAVTCVYPPALESLTNPGAQGFSEILYAWSSAANNNGSAFAGLNADTDFFNAGLALAMWFGRFVCLISVTALAGSLARQKMTAAGDGTLKTYGLLFTVFLSVTVLVVGALTYMPALALGPVAAYSGTVLP